MNINYINKSLKLITLIGLVVGSFTSCKQEDELSLNTPTSKVSINFVGLTATTTSSPGGQLIRYNTSNVNQIVGAPVSITGLQTGENILAIDYRPATGVLYGVGSTSRLYILNPLTGVARAVSSTPFTPAISGGIAGFDFNPTVDRIRLVTKSGQNLRLNPEDGTVVATDANINGIAGAIVAEVAYTNNTSGATSTELFNFDIANAALYKQDANAGTLTAVGATRTTSIISTNSSFSTAYNTNITNARNNATGGFDIASTGDAFVVFNNGSAPAIPVGGISTGNPATVTNAVVGTPTLFKIDIATGRATDYGTINLPTPNGGAAATTIIGIAMAPASVAYAVNESNGLMIFSLTKPEPIVKPITGLQAGENILGLDFRPANGQLYALGSTSRIYTINSSNGVATALTSTPFVPALSGTHFGFDFNPVADAIRITSNTGQNLRYVVATNVNNNDAAITDGDVEQTGVAYSFTGYPTTTATTMYTINVKTDELFRLANPNDGKLTKIGKLKVGAEALNGFDIGPFSPSNTGYAILTKGSETKIYSVNLSLGSATIIGTFPTKVRAFTIGLGF